MRILHINLERGWYGGERQTAYLMEGLAALGHENHAMCRAGDLFAQHTKKIGFTTLEIGKPYLVHGQKLNGYDIIHAHEARGVQLAVLWKGIHRRPVIYTRRVDYFPGRHWFNRYKYSRMDSIVAISSTIFSMMISWGIPSEKMQLIHSSVFLNRASGMEVQGNLEKRFAGKKVIGCVASLVRHKDHFTLIEAADLIRKARNDVVFLLIGEGSLRQELEGKVKRMGLDNVVFEGYQDDPYRYFPIFDVFTLSSREEGLGSSILDAFLYRIPVVATAAGGIPDLVRNGETGILVPVEDPGKLAEGFLTMLNDDTLRKRCVHNAYERLSRDFTVEAMAKAYEGLYRKVLSRYANGR